MKILIVGNYCHDTLVHPNGTHRALGGSPAYASAILTALGADFSVISKVGEDFLYGAELAKAPLVVQGARTTTFVDDFTSGERVETLEARCEPIRPGDIHGSCDVAIACPVAGEILPETLLELRRRARVLVCDIQGLIRVAEPGQKVTHSAFASTPFAPLLDRIDFLKVGAAELAQVDLEEASKRTRVLLTEEARGCTLVDSAGSRRIDAFPAPEVVDATGAGDCFLAGFAFGLSRGWDTEKAALFGNLCGSLAVRQVGVPKLRGSDFSPWHIAGSSSAHGQYPRGLRDQVRAGTEDRPSDRR